MGNRNVAVAPFSTSSQPTSLPGSGRQSRSSGNFTMLARPGGSIERYSVQQSSAAVILPDLNHLPPPSSSIPSNSKGVRSRSRRLSQASTTVKSAATGSSATIKRKKSASKLSSGLRGSFDDKKLPPLLPPLPHVGLPPLPSLNTSVGNAAGPMYSMPPFQAPASIGALGNGGNSFLRDSSRVQVSSRRSRTSSMSATGDRLPATRPVHRQGDWALAEALHESRTGQRRDRSNASIAPTSPQARQLISQPLPVSSYPIRIAPFN